MFEKIVLRRSEAGPALTIGEVAEALLFYEKVHLVLDPGSLTSLINSLGPNELISLIARKRLSAFYSEEMLMNRHDTVGTVRFHSFGAVVISGQAGEHPRKGRKARLAIQFEKSGYSAREARNFAERFARHVQIQKLSSDRFITGGIIKAAEEDMTDANYVTAAVSRVLQDTVGFESFAERLRFEVIHVPTRGFVIQTSINFAEGNERRKALDPTLDAVTEGHILVALLDARADTAIASYYGGDFYTSAVSSNIVRLRHADLLRRSGISNAEISNFKDVFLRDFPTIREVINSGERTFSEFERLLDKSDKFREAIHRMSPDANLVEEYVREITREGWTASLPAKIVRYVVALATGHKSEIAGAVLSAGDNFLLDKLFKGWRPNHFVDGKLKPFLDAG